MTSLQALQLTDPEGSVMVVNRIDTAAITIGITYTSEHPFRMFETDRARLVAFLAEPLDG